MSSQAGSGAPQQGGGAAQGSRFYAIYVTGGYEERVVAVLGERARTLQLDVRSIVYSPDLKGVVFVEVGDVKDLYYLIRGVRNIKRRRPTMVSVDDILKLVKPPAAAEPIAKGDVIQVIGGPFKGMRGRIIEVRKGEVDVNLLEGDSKIIVTIPIDQVKPVGKEREGQEEQGG
ncbi:Putative transcription antitermination protein nusG [Acidilobus saccharovorans 345-15]|uniref:Transcription elongation factor Spt5 n=1 Tax=Acidilobus saccharovorans (strain DSM 16705 / JCM 18335 / VKM B-2471 / 345-15) TaxID=666510 RepID=D9Q213_ACIS3|nr:transcription elongation factor Spt5 [Acidilobus saccharovorans]ADL19351.1 Putative transcription antitermination protein nusG [Acidilobus saccharovorans 345-15]